MDISSKNSKPQMIGYYSITSNRKYDETDSALRYFKHPQKLPLDLNKGIENIKNKPESYFREKMDSILTYISKNKVDFANDSKNNNNYNDNDIKVKNLIPKYITYRGVIRKIMCSPYETRSGWCILATKYKNIIYLCQLTKDSVLESQRNQSFHSKRFAYYGPKFEQYCSVDKPSQSPDTTQQVDACSQFFCVFKRKLMERDFLFAAEMDCVVSETPVNLKDLDNFNKLKFIELKVSADPLTSEYNYKNFIEFKSQNTWTQSFLTGVEDIYFGMRNNEGIVNRIDCISTKKLLDLARNSWNPLKCFEFLDNFLKQVEKEMEEIDCPYTVFEFNYDYKTSNKITCEKHFEKPELNLLPDWYLNAFEK